MPIKVSRRSLFWVLACVFGLTLSVTVAGGVFAARPSAHAAVPVNQASQQVAGKSSSASGALPSSSNGVRLLPIVTHTRPFAFTVDAFAYFTPSTPITVSVGTTFTLNLYINSGSPNNFVTAAQNYLTYNNAVLQVVNPNSACTPISTIQPDLDSFDSVLQNEVCNGPSPCTSRGNTVQPGSIAFASGSIGSCPDGCQGIFRIASVT